MTGAIEVQTPHRGRLFTVEVHSWTDDAGRPVRREIVRHPGAVLVVPVLDAGRLLLVHNWRIAVGRRLWELPAGKLEPGEAPAAAAARELEEETGYRAARLEPLAEFYTSPGFCDERMHAFVGTGLEPVGQRLEPGEDIEVRDFAREALMAMIGDGRIADGKTIAALLLWDRAP